MTLCTNMKHESHHNNSKICIYIYILIHYLNFAFFSLTEDYFLYKVQKVNRSSKFSVSLKFNLDGSLRGHSMKFFPLFVLTWKPRFSGHLYGILKKEGKKINFSNTYYFISTVSSSRNNSKFAKKKKNLTSHLGRNTTGCQWNLECCISAIQTEQEKD